MSSIPLKIDIISDVVCPWCIIGYKGLEQALARIEPDIATRIHWHPLELNPHMPAGGENLRSHLANKYGTTLEGSIKARHNITQLGRGLGFEFNYFDDMRMYNTRKAHKLIHWARNAERQTDLKLALFAAYFTHQQSLDDDAVLLGCVEQCGLSVTNAKAALVDPELDRLLEQASQQWRNRGIQSVPTFIFNDRYMVSGGQSPEALINVIEQVLEQPVS